LFSLLGWTCALAAACGANGEIRQWNPSIQGGFIIDEEFGTIRITAANETEVYKFEAFDPNDNPIDITEITVDSGVGTVMVAVIGDPNEGRTLGAANLHRLDLSGASSSTLVQVKIDADLGEDGPTVGESLGAAGAGAPPFQGWGTDENDARLSSCPVVFGDMTSLARFTS
jgi:hypothetical protein